MDSNKILIVFVLFLVAFLGFPIVAKKMRDQNAVPAPTSTSAPGAVQNTVASPAASYPELNEPPLLNEGNLIGTEWQVQFEKYKVKVTIAAGGVAYATHPMAKALTGMDYVEGRWRLQQEKLFVNANLGGNELAIELRIAGSKVFSLDKKGKPSEVKRF